MLGEMERPQQILFEPEGRVYLLQFHELSITEFGQLER
jgi:hypothetical protein